ncbi:hypothetical protein [Mesorhizobium sp. IMUNJ 23232]|uniref:hypothetical protein n=1 Tax=Mesorhizobium sp. IMUNJ 23232 TaxID=3376064 RepID=UPI0037B56C0E
MTIGGQLTRRAMLASTPALAVAVATPAAASASDNFSLAETVEANPLDRVIRISRELSQALADWNDALGGSGPWVARIYPKGSREYPIGFEDSSVCGPSLAIMKLFDEWDALYRYTYHLECPDDEMDGYTDRMLELERQIVALPASTAVDLAAKIVALTGYGVYEFSPDARPNIATWTELERLVGRTSPEREGGVS